jgi:predicted Rossmann fold nucleotide-binding protein DprA/Smf involved in DNA uptake
LKQEYGTDTIIVSGGAKEGADRYAKKYALELGLQYEEYPPSHFSHNLYCPLPESRYGKEYSPKNYHVRNKIIVGTSDYIVAFKKIGEDSKGTDSTINYAKKFSKKYVIIE